MAEPEFPEFAIKYAKSAQETRKTLPPEVRPTVDLIESELVDDPNMYPERIIPASLDGTSFVYMHPDPVIQITFQVDKENKVLYFFHYSAPAFKVQKTIFVSYSHADRPWLEKLRKFLTVIEQQGVMQFWDDSQLEVGVPWEDQVKKILDSNQGGLLLVSQEFLSSKFIKETELPKLLDQAEQEGKKIFWLHLSPSTVFETHKEITKYQSLLDDPQTSLEELEEPQQRKVLVQMSKKLAEAVSTN